MLGLAYGCATGSLIDLAAVREREILFRYWCGVRL